MCEHLLRNNRPVVQEFQSEERLYYAFNAEIVEEEGRRIVPADAIKVSYCSISVNRSQFSKPEDLYCIKKFVGFGILAWKKCELPIGELKSDNPKAAKYEFVLSHEPLDDNYAHSEFQFYKNGTFKRSTRLPDLLERLKIRMALSEIAVIHKEPTL